MTYAGSVRRSTAWRVRLVAAFAVIAMVGFWAASANAGANTIWLCKPGVKPDPMHARPVDDRLLADAPAVAGDPSQGGCHADVRLLLRLPDPRAELERTRLPRAQIPKPSPDPIWGLHLLDGNVELGNLVSVVNAQANHWLDPRYGHSPRRAG